MMQVLVPSLTQPPVVPVPVVPAPPDVPLAMAPLAETLAAESMVLADGPPELVAVDEGLLPPVDAEDKVEEALDESDARSASGVA
jgi:hypothetical protein